MCHRNRNRPLVPLRAAPAQVEAWVPHRHAAVRAAPRLVLPTRQGAESSSPPVTPGLAGSCPPRAAAPTPHTRDAPAGTGPGPHTLLSTSPRQPPRPADLKTRDPSRGARQAANGRSRTKPRKPRSRQPPRGGRRAPRSTQGAGERGGPRGRARPDSRHTPAGCPGIGRTHSGLVAVHLGVLEGLHGGRRRRETRRRRGG